jgi:WD40 repeat protein
MNSFENENILILIFNSFTLLQSKQIFSHINNKIISGIILRLLCYKSIYTSIGKRSIPLHGYESSTVSFTLLPNNNLITVTNKSLRVWDLATYKCIKIIEDEKTLTSVILLKDNSSIYCLHYRYVKVRNINEDFEVEKVYHFGDYEHIGDLLILANGNVAGTAYCRGQFLILIYDVQDQITCIRTLNGNNWWMALENLSNNNFASLSIDNVISIWDIDQEYMCIKNIEVGVENTCGMFFIEKQNVLLSGSNNGVVKVWELLNYQCIKIVESIGGVDKFILLPNGYFASCSYKGKIKIWDTKGFRLVNSFGSDEDYVSSLLLLKEHRIVSITNATVIIWDY